MRQQEVIEETVSVVKRTVVSETVTCDLCGAQSLSQAHAMDEYSGTSNWLDDEAVEFDGTTIVRERGVISQYGGKSTIEAFNICPACWPRLAAWIALYNGAKPTQIDNSWGDQRNEDRSPHSQS